MSQERLPPPEPLICLVRPYPSSQKGGTLIAEDVLDKCAHEQRLRDPDGYRPPYCLRCLHNRLHVHDYRQRVVRADPDMPVTRIVRHKCANEECGAIWQTLPVWLCRWLWRTWPLVQAAVEGLIPNNSPQVPARTVRRWRGRLKSSARVLVNVLAACGEIALEAIASAVGLCATRNELVNAWRQSFTDVAGHIHRLTPGVRLM